MSDGQASAREEREKKGSIVIPLEERETDEPRNKFLKPLSIAAVVSELDAAQEKASGGVALMPCLLCDETFHASETGTGNPILAHLMKVHKFIIAEVQNIASFTAYARYWKQRLAEVRELTDVCVLINTNTAETDIDATEKFYLLTDFLPEDHQLRDQLAKAKLTRMLDEHLRERSDESFARNCLFCKETFVGRGKRTALFRHLALEHSFNLGNADNITSANRFLDLLQEELEKSTCLFCEQQFEDWNALKEHMRKKGHKRINPKNIEYDKYYLINYLDPGKNWKDMQHDPEYENEDDGDDNDVPVLHEEEWADWTEENSRSLCLFCSHTNSNVTSMFEHMRTKHDFNAEKPGTTFYDRVKAVNFIRRKVYVNTCPYCSAEHETKASLEQHMQVEKHSRLPEDSKEWSASEFFLPTFEDDQLLYHLQDEESDGELEGAPDYTKENADVCPPECDIDDDTDENDNLQMMNNLQL